MNNDVRVEIAVYATNSRSTIYLKRLDPALDVAYALISCHGIDEVRVIRGDNEMICILYRGMRPWARRHILPSQEE